MYLRIATKLFVLGSDGSTASADAEKGNLYIPAASVSSSGVRLNSPVYTGKNIALTQFNKKSYTPVTFFDDVTLGTGRIVDESGAGITFNQTLDSDAT